MASGDQPIRYRLSADGAAQTQSAMESVRQSLARLDKQGGVTAVSLGDVGAAVGRFASLVGLAGGLSLAGLVGFAKQVADGVDNLNDLRDATGASIENLSALEDIALRTGTSVDVAGDAVVKLNKSLNDASQNPKSGAAQVIRDLGLSVEDLRKLDPVEALQQIAVAFEGVATDGEKGRHLLELTGKSVKELAPLMKDLAEAGRLNATVTAQQAEEAERLNKTWSSLKKDGLDLARSVALPLIQAMNQVAGAFKDTDTYAGELGGTAKALAVPLQTLAVLGVTLADVFGGIGREIGGVAAEAAALLSFDRAAASVIRQERIADHEAAKKRLDELTARILNLNGAANDALRRQEDRGFTPETRRRLPALGNESSGAGAKPDKGRSPLPAAPISQALADALRAIDQTDVAKIAQVTAALDELFNLRASGIGGDAAVDEAIAKLRDDLEKLRKGADVTISTIASRMEEFRASELALQETVNESLRLDKLTQSTSRKLDEWSVFAEEGARNIQDALGTTLEATLSGHFDNIGQLWKSLLIRMASEALSAQIGKELFGDFGSPGKSGGGSIGGIIGQLLSNLPSLFSQLPSFDTGTAYVPRDMVAQVHQGERIVPAAENRRGASGAAPVSITQVFNVSGDVGERTVQLLEGMIQRNNARLQRSMRTGGAWSAA